MSVWRDLYDEEAVTKAQSVIAAAHGANTNPLVLVTELGKVTEWLMPLLPNGEVDSDTAAKRTLHFYAALTMLARMAVDQFATMVESAKIESEDEEWPEPDPEAVRNTAFELLGQYADNLRELSQ